MISYVNKICNAKFILNLFNDTKECKYVNNLCSNSAKYDIDNSLYSMTLKILRNLMQTLDTCQMPKKRNFFKCLKRGSFEQWKQCCCREN